MIVVFIIVAFLVVLFLEAVYCHLQKKSKVSKELSKQNIINATESGGKSKSEIYKWFIVLANDTVYLTFKIIGYIPCHAIRIFIYKNVFCMSLENNVVIYYGMEARMPWNIKIGQGTVVGDKAIFDARYGIEIGSNVNISTGVWIWTLQHDVNSNTFTSQGTDGKVIIDDRVWLSSRSTVLPGVNIKEGCVLAAGGNGTEKYRKFCCLWGCSGKKDCREK